jgi:hypothetical protein
MKSMNDRFVKHKQQKQHGMASLEVVMILPLLVLFFVFIFYLSSNARQHITHIFSVRNHVWSQRYTPAAPTSTPYLFPANNKTIAAEYISLESTETIRTGTWFDKYSALKKSFARSYVLTGKTWDYDMVDCNKKLPNYFRDPFTNIPKNLQSLGSLRFDQYDQLLELLIIESLRQYLLSLIAEKGQTAIDKLLEAGGSKFLEMVIRTGGRLIVDNLLKLSGELLDDYIREIGGEEFYNQLYLAGRQKMVLKILQNSAGFLMPQRISPTSPINVHVNIPVLNQNTYWITVNQIFANKRMTLDEIQKAIERGERVFTEDEINYIIGREYGAGDYILEGIKVFENAVMTAEKTISSYIDKLKNWKQPIVDTIISTGILELIKQIKQCKNLDAVYNILKDWAIEKAIEKAKELCQNWFGSNNLEMFVKVVEILERLIDISKNIADFFKNFNLDQIVDQLVGEVKKMASSLSGSLGVNLELDAQLFNDLNLNLNLNLQFDFELDFKFDHFNLRN